MAAEVTTGEGSGGGVGVAWSSIGVFRPPVAGERAPPPRPMSDPASREVDHDGGFPLRGEVPERHPDQDQGMEGQRGRPPLDRLPGQPGFLDRLEFLGADSDERRGRRLRHRHRPGNDPQRIRSHRADSTADGREGPSVGLADGQSYSLRGRERFDLITRESPPGSRDRLPFGPLGQVQRGSALVRRLLYRNRPAGLLMDSARPSGPLLESVRSGRGSRRPTRS